MAFDELYDVEDQAGGTGHSKTHSKIPCFSPKSKKIQLWGALVAAASFITTVFTIFQVCFDTSTMALWGVQYFLDVIYLVNIISQFYIGFQSSSGIVITDSSVVRKRYLRKWFIVDILAIFPFELIKAAYPNEDVWKILAFCRLNRLLRVLRLFAFMSSLSQEPGVNKVYLAAVNYFCILAVCVHTGACIWYSLVCTPSQSSQERICKDAFTWVVLLESIGQNMTAMSLIENYVISIYWSVITLTTVGYGDIHAENSLEALFCVLLLFVSLLVLTGIVISGMSSIVTNLDARRGRYYHRLDVIKKNMMDIGLDKEVQSWVTDYYGYLWKHQRGCLIQGLLNDLPYTMYSEISMACYEPMLSKADIFRGLDEGFLRAVSVAIRPQIYSIGQTLAKRRETKQTMYYIRHGLVQKSALPAPLTYLLPPSILWFMDVPL